MSLVLLSPAVANDGVNVHQNDGQIELQFDVSEVPESPHMDFGKVTVRWAADPTEMCRVDMFYLRGSVYAARLTVPNQGVYQYDASLPDGTSISGDFNASASCNQGRLRVSDDQTHLVTHDGQPFFWLADTAWNGVLRSRIVDWQRYLAHRSNQRFTAIQFVMTPWRGARETLSHSAFQLSGSRWVDIDDRAMSEMEQKIRMINAYGMVAVPVMMWAINQEDPGHALTEADAIALTRYQKARFGSLRCAWFLGGDSKYEDAARWQRIGRAVFGTDDGWMQQLATLHPAGLHWTGDDFEDESWLDFYGYQSGHGEIDDHLRRHLSGPWSGNRTLDRPVINLEPNYEAITAYRTGTIHGARNVRRAAYWSMMLSPTVGTSFGHHSIWVWNDQDGLPPEGHRPVPVESWRAGLNTNAIESMTRLRNFFETGSWWLLEPVTTFDDDLEDVASTVTVAATPDLRWIVAYSPVGKTVDLGQISLGDNANGYACHWVDPRQGTVTIAAPDDLRFTPPDEQDWLLSLRKLP
ncbi:MAG: DUF4038 domain-containing protein [Planctomycetota bacterium]